MLLDARPGLHVDDLTVSYRKQVALDGVSLTAKPGAILGLVGANGAGKSTLFHAVIGRCRRVDLGPSPGYINGDHEAIAVWVDEGRTVLFPLGVLSRHPRDVRGDQPVHHRVELAAIGPVVALPVVGCLRRRIRTHQCQLQLPDPGQHP